MKLQILACLFGIFASAVCRNINPKAGEYWFTSFTETSSSGPIEIADLCCDGKYIELANWSDERQYLNGWTIKQKVRGEVKAAYTFQYCSIPPESKRKIYAHKWTNEADAKDFVATDVDRWATGDSIQTYLYNRNGTIVAKYEIDRSSSTGMLE